MLKYKLCSNNTVVLLPTQARYCCAQTLVSRARHFTEVKVRVWSPSIQHFVVLECNKYICLLPVRVPWLTLAFAEVCYKMDKPAMQLPKSRDSKKRAC